jgi:hypothetical protein
MDDSESLTKQAARKIEPGVSSALPHVGTRNMTREKRKKKKTGYL